MQRVTVALLLTANVALAGASASTGALQQSYRAAVELVVVSVTVTGVNGRYVSDLASADFTLLEDGRPQEVTFFSPPSTALLAVSLLIDSSASMEHQLSVAQKAAVEFVGRLRPGDTAQIVDVAGRVRLVQEFTGERAALESAISKVRGGGVTSLYNAIYIALRQLERVPPTREGQTRRKVAVVLTDGRDTSSLIAFDDLLDVVKRGDVAMYPVRFASTPPPTQSRPDPDFDLRRLARETGGRMLEAADAVTLSNVYGEIADELTSQYVLGYLSNNVDRGDGWRSISVRVGRPNVQVRTRTGYHFTSRR